MLPQIYQPTAGCLVFLPEDVPIGSFSWNSHHPWGCILSSTRAEVQQRCPPNNSIIIVVLGFITGCPDVSADELSLLLRRTPQSTGSADTTPIGCLVPNCLKCNQSDSAKETLSFFHNRPDAALWISFRWDLLSSLRRYAFARMLDSLGSTVVQSAIFDKPNWSISQLIHMEHDWLKNRVGGPLTALVERFTTSPMHVHQNLIDEGLPEADSGSKPSHFWNCLAYLRSLSHRFLHASYTYTLVRFHLTHNGQTMRLRGLLPRHPVREELLTIDNPLLFLTVTTKYTRNTPVYHRAVAATGARRQYTDAGMSLLGAVQLLLLVLSLLAPLHRSFETTRPSDTKAVNKLDEQDWLISETDCTRVPTLGWFYVNNSNASNPERYPPIILPGAELLRNLSSSKTNSTEYWFTVVNRWIEFFTCELIRLLVWTESGEPAGLKINLHLARLLSRFFLYHILAWRIYTSFLIHLAAWAIGLLQQLTSVDTLDTLFYANLYTSTCLLLSTVYLVSSASNLVDDTVTSVFSTTAVLLTYISSVLRLSVALFGCILLDLVNLTTVHLTTFYIYAVRLLVLQTRVIGASWRLCRNASKWNPLRARVDTVSDMYNAVGAKVFTSDTRSGITNQVTAYQDDSHLDRLFVATLLGLAVGLCLLPTTLAFYLTFAIIRLLTVVVQQMLKQVIVFVLDVPVSSLFAWILHTKRSQTELVMTAPMHPKSSVPMLKLKLVRPSFRETYELNRFLHTCDILGPNIPLAALIRRMWTAVEI